MTALSLSPGTVVVLIFNVSFIIGGGVSSLSGVLRPEGIVAISDCSSSELGGITVRIDVLRVTPPHFL